MALAKVCCFTRRGQRFALGLKIEKQKDRIGHVVGIAGGGSNVSRGEEMGQGGQCYGAASQARKRIECGV